MTDTIQKNNVAHGDHMDASTTDTQPEPHDRKILRTLKSISFYLLAFLAGSCVTYYSLKIGLKAVSNVLPASSFYDFYKVIGHAFWGLFPMTLCLVVLVGKDL